MKEVFKVGYTTYLEKSKKSNWTSKIGRIIENHKFVITILGVIIMCLVINFWLIYKFFSFLEMSRIF